jgi:hypothetical protein
MTSNTRKNHKLDQIANFFGAITLVFLTWTAVGFVAMYFAPHNKVLTSGATFALDLLEKLVTQC